MRVRIVTDAYCGYEVQVWRWWLPFWLQHNINTHPSIEDAEEYAAKVKCRVVKYCE